MRMLELSAFYPFTTAAYNEERIVEVDILESSRAGDGSSYGEGLREESQDKGTT